ncbi:MAG: hypothetical protein JXR71_11020 [Bacteroidales bacterium]|nr:hypothetical protein [Bacteroidales bacterium]
MKTQYFKLSLLVGLLMMIGTSCKKENNASKPLGTIYSLPVRYVKIIDNGAFAAKCSVHWGANGTSSSVHDLSAFDKEYTWDLSHAGIPEQWRFWASIDVNGGPYIDSNKDSFHYDPKSTKTVVFTLTGPVWNPLISQKY